MERGRIGLDSMFASCILPQLPWTYHIILELVIYTHVFPALKDMPSSGHLYWLVSTESAV